jgi:hypothetical protein
MKGKQEKATKLSPESPKLGRPKTGKRSNAEYRQVSAWIKRSTYAEVRLRLFIHAQKEPFAMGPKEFSELVEVLLQQWLLRRPKN